MNRVQYTKINDMLSDAVIISIGTVQGACLSPLIYIIFTADLALHIQDDKVIVFADDISAIDQGSSIIEITNRMKETANTILHYMAINKLIPNIEKTKMLVIHPVRHRTGTEQVVSLQLGTQNDKTSNGRNTFKPSTKNDIISEESKIKILGVMISQDPKWEEHIRYITSDMAIRLNIIRRLKD